MAARSPSRRPAQPHAGKPAKNVLTCTDDTQARRSSAVVLAGEPLAPELPETAAALAAGEIGPAHARVITEIMDAMPASTTIAQRAEVEADLGRHARTFGPTELAKLGQHMLAHLDPDGDIHATADYRRHLAGALTTRALRAALQPALGEAPDEAVA